MASEVAQGWWGQLTLRGGLIFPLPLPASEDMFACCGLQASETSYSLHGRRFGGAVTCKSSEMTSREVSGAGGVYGVEYGCWRWVGVGSVSRENDRQAECEERACRKAGGGGVGER